MWIALQLQSHFICLSVTWLVSQLVSLQFSPIPLSLRPLLSPPRALIHHFSHHHHHPTPSPTALTPSPPFHRVSMPGLRWKTRAAVAVHDLWWMLAVNMEHESTLRNWWSQTSLRQADRGEHDAREGGFTRLSGKRSRCPKRAESEESRWCGAKARSSHRRDWARPQKRWELLAKQSKS